jgi:hypothetical protein
MANSTSWTKSDQSSARSLAKEHSTSAMTMNQIFFATRFTVFATFFKFSPHTPIFSPPPPYVFAAALCSLRSDNLL